ncbi:MAG TPA: LuxR C-terminal-related transcriptional regulator [Propionibacteriaceae bacterium]|nr:LuxR C-terminal-related transcriptional regulator [Propionibacteriaceae bacterium]
MSSLEWNEGAPDGEPVDPMLEVTLRPPPLRSEWVTRSRLLEDLEKAAQRPVTLVSAPAGYGKTTLVTQWLASGSRPATVAWVSLDTADNDPVRLWSHIATALNWAGCTIPRDVAGFAAAGAGDLTTSVLPRIIDAFATRFAHITLVIDDFQLVHSAECSAQFDFLIEHLPVKAHLVLITRSDPALRLGRLRVSGKLSEIRADDLAFNMEEASLLLSDGVRLSSDLVSELIDRTEGWPAGLYLARLSLAGRANPTEFVRNFTGNDRFIAEYLTDEVLSRHTDEMRNFILDMSVVDRFSAPLADYVTGSHRSASLLRELEQSNLFLIPLNAEARWFRFHHLFGSVARSALEAERPDVLPELHQRAADWLSANGYVDESVQHALSAGAYNQAASLVQANWLRYFDAGLATTVRGWLRALEASTADESPATTVTAAWMAALSGDREELSRRLAQLGSTQDGGPLPDGTKSAESAAALIRGLFGFGGPVDMLASARLAVALEEKDGSTPSFAIAQVALGHASYVAGALSTAMRTLESAAYSDAAPALVKILALGTLSLTCAESGSQERARSLAREAIEIVETRTLQALPNASMAFTALGQSQAAVGELRDAMATLEYGLTLRRKLPGLSPWPTIHHLLIMSRVASMSGDLLLAGRLLDEVSLLIQPYHQGMAHMVARVEEVRKALRAASAPQQDSEALTAREIDVLRLLTGSQSLGEIAAELYLSPNTVKTHTTAVYRKLGARSRSEAVRIGRERMLI